MDALITKTSLSHTYSHKYITKKAMALHESEREREMFTKKSMGLYG